MASGSFSKVQISKQTQKRDGREISRPGPRSTGESTGQSIPLTRQTGQSTWGSTWSPNLVLGLGAFLRIWSRFLSRFICLNLFKQPQTQPSLHTILFCFYSASVLNKNKNGVATLLESKLEANQHQPKQLNSNQRLKLLQRFCNN